MALLIKRRIDCSFIGAGYEEAYLEFRAIPMADYEKILETINEAESGKEKKYTKLLLTTLKEYFIRGKFPNEKGELAEFTDKEELNGLDEGTAVHCFQIITGQIQDPKLPAPSMNVSTMEQPNQ